MLNAQQARGLWVSEERVDELRQLVIQPGTHHQRAFVAMKDYIDSNQYDVIKVPSRQGTTWNPERSYLAQQAALASLLSTAAQDRDHYANVAYDAVRAIYDDPDADGHQLTGSNSNLSKATISMAFSLSYDWAYERWTAPQRAWVLEKMTHALGVWPSIGHTNFGGNLSSNHLAVFRGAEMCMLLSAGEELNQPARYKQLRGNLLTNANTHGSRGWGQEGNYYMSYGQIFLLPAKIAVTRSGDPTMKVNQSQKQHHLVPMFASMYSPTFDSINWGVGGAIWDGGFISLNMEAAPEGEKAYYRWFFDRYMGVLNPVADSAKFDAVRQGRIWSILYYPDHATPVSPATAYPVAIEDTGGFFMRSGWDDVNDVLIYLGTDRAFYSPGWDAPDALSMVLMANGKRYLNGPGNTAHEPSAKDLYSTILVDNAVAVTGQTGGRLDFRLHEKGAYAIATGGSAYANMGVGTAHRHLLADFSGASGSEALLGVRDKLRTAHGSHEYRWQINTADSQVTVESSAGRPSFTLGHPGEDGYLRGWVLHPADAVIQTGAGRLFFNVNGEDADLWVVMAVGTGSAPSPVISGVGMDSQFSLHGTLLTYDHGSDRMQHNQLTFTAPPVAAFTTSATSGQAPLEVTFNAGGSTSPAGITAYQWDFGDGSTGSGLSATHTYSTEGVYAATLQITDADGRHERAQRTVVAGYQWPTAGFTVSPVSGQPPLEVTIDPASSIHPDGLPLTYHWDLGNGTTYTTTDATPFTQWYEVGTYKPKLIVTDGHGGFDFLERTVTVANRAPSALVDWSTGGGQGPLTVHFRGERSSDPDGDAMTFLWHFGDGTTSTEMNPTHVYTNAGNFSVSLIVTDALGATGTRVVPNPIVVLDGSNPAPSIAAESLPGILHGLEYSIHANSDAEIGLYFTPDLLPTLIDSVIDNFYIWPSVLGERFGVRYRGYLDIPEDGVYTFYFDLEQGGQLKIGDSVLFQRSSFIGSAGLWNSITLAAGLHPIEGIFYYNNKNVGTSFPSLTASWSGPGFDRRQIDQDRLFWTPGRPVADFVYSPAPDTPLMPVLYNFDASRSRAFGGDSITAYTWTFADGTIKNGRVVSHSLAGGTHLVKLTVTTSQGLKAERGIKVLVVPAQDFELAGGIDRGPMPGRMATARGSFTNSGPENAFDGDKTTRWLDLSLTSWLEISFHHKGQPQPYVISEYRMTSLTLWNQRDPFSWNFYGSHDGVDWVLLDSVSGNNFSGSNPRTNRFPIGNTTAYSFYRFGEIAATSTSSAPDATGLNLIELIDYGIGDQPASTPPVASFDISGPVPAVGEIVSFNGSASYDPEGYPLYYNWDFGDGQTQSGWELNEVQHVYNSSGEYTVTLKIMDAIGDYAQTTGNVMAATVPNQDPVASFIISSDTGLQGYTTISLDASASFDPDGDPITFEWDVGNGEKLRGPVVTFPLSVGKYSPSLVVRDNRGGYTRYSENLNISLPLELPRTIGLNMAGSRDEREDLLLSNQVAGFIPQAYWNNIHISSMGGLIDSTGVATNVSVTRGSTYRSTDTAPRTPDHRLMRVGAGGPISVTGVPYAVYDVYVYHSSLSRTDGEVFSILLSSNGAIQTTFVRQDNWEWNGRYGISTATSAATAVHGNNVVILSGITHPDFVLTATSRQGRNVAHAVQIVDASSGANTRPLALIASPSSNSEFVAEVPIQFVGETFDLEDGELPGSALRWESNINGVLGTGSSLSTDSLSPGVHLITFTAVDSGGLVGSASISITVLGDVDPGEGVAPPTGFTTAGLSPNSIQLIWTASLSVVDGYRLERRVDGTGDWLLMYEGAIAGYTHNGLLPDREYEYRLTAFIGAESSLATTATFRTLGLPVEGVLARFTFDNPASGGDILVNASRAGVAAPTMVGTGVSVSPMSYSGRPTASADSLPGTFVTRENWSTYLFVPGQSGRGHALIFAVTNNQSTAIPLDKITFLSSSNTTNLSRHVIWSLASDLGNSALSHNGGPPASTEGFTVIGTLPAIYGTDIVPLTFEFSDGTEMEPGATWRFIMYFGANNSQSQAYLDDLTLHSVPADPSDPQPGSFAAWTNQHFDETEQMDPSVSGPSVQLRNDGVSNALKYVLGVSPWDSVPSDYLPKLVPDGNQLILSYLRDSSLPDGVERIEWSDDLSSWQSSGVSYSINPEDYHERVEASVLLDGRTKVFLRLVITVGE